jgi:hypothetical protein
MDAPIFIVGANRSGTTLLRLILNAHPRIAFPDELIYFDSYLAGVPIERWRDPELSPSAYEDFVDRLLAETRAPLEALDQATLRQEILNGPANFRYPYRCALEAWARHHGKPRWGEKTPGNLFYVDVIHEMFPDAQFLYMVRDPRAGVASMQRVSFFPEDITFNALSRRKHDIEGRALLERHVPTDQRMAIRYEDLVRRPRTTTQSICHFLDEPFQPSMLAFHKKAGRYMKDDAQADYNVAATEPITDDRVDAWKEQLSPRQTAIVEHLCASVMQTWGYGATDHDMALVEHVRVAVKQVYWHFQCWRHRDVRHYTVKHPILARTRKRTRALLNQIACTLPLASSSRRS